MNKTQNPNQTTAADISDVIELLVDAASEGLLEDTGVEEFDDLADASSMSFDRAGVMTTDAGFVLTLAQGRRFYITVKEA